MAGEKHRKCTRCIYCGPVSTFPMKKNLQHLLTCNECTQKGAAAQKTKGEQRAQKENASEPIRSNRRGLAPEQEAIMTMSWSEVNSSEAFDHLRSALRPGTRPQVGKEGQRGPQAEMIFNTSPAQPAMRSFLCLNCSRNVSPCVLVTTVLFVSAAWCHA